jgi:hypothetical protein
MSKKLNTKKKVNVKVLPGQAIYVASMDRFDHIISMYDSMAMQLLNKSIDTAIPLIMCFKIIIASFSGILTFPVISV